MPQQLTLATQCDAGFEAHRKTTRRDVFLAEMDKVVPWSELCGVIEPFYLKLRADGGGRLTAGLERRLRIRFLQQYMPCAEAARSLQCFSEAPLPVVPQGAVNAGAYSRYTPFGVLADKRRLFVRGGRPVIYQSEQEYAQLPEALRLLAAFHNVQDWQVEAYAP